MPRRYSRPYSVIHAVVVTPLLLTRRVYCISVNLTQCFDPIYFSWKHKSMLGFTVLGLHDRIYVNTLAPIPLNERSD
jgi:hypothetical protein